MSRRLASAALSMVVAATVSLAVGVGPTRADTPVDDVHYTFTTGTSVAAR